MGLKGLAEGIIIQSLEDLWNEHHREGCAAFFRGEDFRLCAEMAGMSLSEQVKLLDMVKGVVKYHRKSKGTERNRSISRSMQKTVRKWGSKELAHCR